MDNTPEKLSKIIKNLKMGFLILYTLVCMTFKMLLDIFKALLIIIVSLINFISSFGELFIAIIVFITSVDKLFKSDFTSQQLCIDYKSSQSKHLEITEID